MDNNYIKICNQVSIPEVDNTQLECDEFMNSTCINVKQISNKVKNLEGENLDKFIDRLNYKLTLIDNNLYSMTQEIKVLKERIKILEDE